MMKRRIIFTIVITILTGSPSQAIPDWKDSIVTIYSVDPLKEEVYQGSGFAVRDDTIVTNFHVVYPNYRNKTPLLVLSERGAFFGQIICANPLKDVALVNVKAHPFAALSVRKTYSLKRGEKVYIITNPEGEGIRLYEGAILNTLGPELIQTNVHAKEGFSGSPLMNARGEVIGIVTFQLRERGDTFAISLRPIFEKGWCKEGHGKI